jgi:hypothetical protein
MQVYSLQRRSLPVVAILILFLCAQLSNHFGQAFELHVQPITLLLVQTT